MSIKLDLWHLAQILQYITYNDINNDWNQYAYSTHQV
jgi:hypothetical protein